MACNGRRTVLVHQPPIKCPRCVGTGRSGSRDRAEFSNNFLHHLSRHGLGLGAGLIISGPANLLEISLFLMQL